MNQTYCIPSSLLEPEEDLATAYRSPEGFTHAAIDAQRLFTERYPIIRTFLEKYRARRGVAIFAFDERSEAIAQGFIEASEAETRCASIGRHTQAQIKIPDDQPTVALRHLAVLVRGVEGTKVRIRVIDLKTGLGFGDESGRALEALVSEGSIFLAIDRIQLAILVTGANDVLPEDAVAAYLRIPERIFIEERARKTSFREATVGEGPYQGVTMVYEKAGPVHEGEDLMGEDSAPLARMTITTDGIETTSAVGPSALERGILIGRYDRCDVRAATFRETISRVHLLITSEGTDVVAIDVASMNGTLLNEQGLVLARLKFGDMLHLASRRESRVVWDAPDGSR